METAKDLFQCEACEGKSYVEVAPVKVSETITLNMKTCPLCGGNGKDDTKIAAYFRDNLEDALAGKKMVEKMRETGFNVFERIGTGYISINGETAGICWEGKDSTMECDSLQEAITKLLS